MRQSISTTFQPAARLRVVLVGMTLTVLAAIGHTAWAQPAPPPGGPNPGGPMAGGPHPSGPMAGGPGWGHHDHGGGMGGMMFGGSPEHVGRAVDHMLDGLDASDAQRTQIKQIAVAAASDLKAMAPAGRDLRQRGMQVFAAPNVDANAAEALRQQMLQQHDQASRRIQQAMLDVARVLTPEQRAKIAERLRDRQARMDERMKRMERR